MSEVVKQLDTRNRLTLPVEILGKVQVGMHRLVTISVDEAAQVITIKPVKMEGETKHAKQNN